TIKSRPQPIHIGGVPPRDEQLASDIASALRRFGETHDSAMLLSLASLIASQDRPHDALARLGETLCEAAAGNIGVEIPRERLLAAADTSMAAIRWLGGNADVGLLAGTVRSGEDTS